MIKSLALLAAVAGASPVGAHAAEAAGAWKVEETASKLDGATSFVASVESPDEVSGILDTPKHPNLMVGCTNGRVAVMIDWPDFVGSLGENHASVRWRMDSGAIQSTYAFAGTTSAMVEGRDAYKWIDTMAAGHKLVVQVPDRHGGQEATFAVDGVAPIRDHMREMKCT